MDNSSINSEIWMTLGVPIEIIKALDEKRFNEPTLIQSLTIPPAILGKRDILGAAETGSGKTLAFGIPVLTGILSLKEKLGKEISTTSGVFREVDRDVVDSDDDQEKEINNKNQAVPEKCCLNEQGIGLVRVVDNVSLINMNSIEKPLKPLFALILTPTRELAIQIKNHIIAAAKYTDIKVAVIVGGMAAVKQERILKKGPEIVIATPGRLWELIEEGNPHLSQLGSIRYLVIDETDRMLERGHFEELHRIIEKINQSEKNIRKRQTFVYSATLTLVHDIPNYLQRKKIRNKKAIIFKLTPGQKLQKIIELLCLKNPKIVDITKGTGTASTLTECRIACTIDHKDHYLYYFLQRHPGRTLVFCNSIGCVKRLATLLSILHCKPLPLHASMPQRQRLKNLERFQADTKGLLIATDVAARGLDIPNIEHVIHYQVPRTSESYVHRSGRTARAQKEGITVLMMEPSEKELYSRLCKTLDRTEDLPTFPVVDRLLIAVKEIVNLAREIDQLDLRYRRESGKKGWLQKAAKEMDLIVDDNEFDCNMEEDEAADIRRSVKAKKSILTKLIEKPLFPKGYSGKYPDLSIEISLQQGSQKAIDVMKKAMEKQPKSKQKLTKTLKQKNKSIKRLKEKKKQLKEGNKKNSA